MRAIAAYGHSPGHTVFRIETGEVPLFVTGDVAQNPALFLAHPDWHSQFDQDPALAVATRWRILERAASERAIVTGTHWGLCHVGTVRRADGGFSLMPLAAADG